MAIEKAVQLSNGSDRGEFDCKPHLPHIIAEQRYGYLRKSKVTGSFPMRPGAGNSQPMVPSWTRFYIERAYELLYFNMHSDPPGPAVMGRNPFRKRAAALAKR